MVIEKDEIAETQKTKQNTHRFHGFPVKYKRGRGHYQTSCLCKLKRLLRFQKGYPKKLTTEYIHDIRKKGHRGWLNFEETRQQAWWVLRTLAVTNVECRSQSSLTTKGSGLTDLF